MEIGTRSHSYNDGICTNLLISQIKGILVDKAGSLSNEFFIPPLGHTGQHSANKTVSKLADMPHNFTVSTLSCNPL